MGAFWNTHQIYNKLMTKLKSQVRSTGKIDQPKVKDYVFTFEAQGVTPLFQEIVCKDYMPRGSVLLFLNGNVRTFISKASISQMHKIGVEFFTEKEKCCLL